MSKAPNEKLSIWPNVAQNLPYVGKYMQRPFATTTHHCEIAEGANSEANGVCERSCGRVTEEEGHSGEGEKREDGSARFVRREDGRGEGEEPPMWRAVVTGRWSVCGSQ